MIAAIEQEERRFMLERSDTKGVKSDIIHELVNSLLYLRLEQYTDTVMAIHFGIEQVNQLGQLSALISQFLRVLYRETSKEVTTITIEDCVTNRLVY
jgi:hypothetical protein